MLSNDNNPPKECLYSITRHRPEFKWIFGYSFSNNNMCVVHCCISTTDIIPSPKCTDIDLTTLIPKGAFFDSENSKWFILRQIQTCL